MHRTASGFGPAPLSWVDIDAFQRVTDVRLTALELEVVFELDVLFLQNQAQAMKHARPKARKGGS